MLFGCLNESGWTEIFPNIDPTSLVYGPCCQKWVRLPDAHKLNSVFEAFIPSPSGTRFSEFIIFRFPPPFLLEDYLNDYAKSRQGISRT